MTQALAQAETSDGELDRPLLEASLSQTWGTPPGFWNAIATVDHKIIGKRYILTAFLFLCLGGILAALMRIQLAQP
jgi:hypothetical protein